MAKIISKAVRGVMGGVAGVAMGAVVLGSAAYAQTGTNATPDERYVPAIWIDPDGCEHWVMDDGAEGYGDNRLRRDGTPICHDVNVCGVMNTDQFFATNSYRIGASGKDRLREFFESADAFAYTIVGHTDSRASDEYNMRLSYNRANAVAGVASEIGARVIDVRGYGERVPAAPNNSAAGMAKNRRVEILCFR